MKKTSELQRAKRRAQNKFNEWIRLRDCYASTGAPFSGICVTCNKETENDRHLVAGHFILDSKNGNLTSFDEVNVNIQCQVCNRYNHGRLDEYAIFILRKYGQDELFRLKSSKLISKKWTIDELEAIYLKYKEKIKTDFRNY